jgi:hypothetical protein
MEVISMNSKDLATGKTNPNTAREGGDAVSGDASTPDKPAPVAFDQHYDMPDTYMKPRAVLLLRNPQWLFLHWDFDGETKGRLVAAGQEPQLRVLQNGREISRTGVDIDTRRYYIKVPDGGGSIQAQLGREGRGEFLAILSSESVVVPAARVSDDLTVTLAAPAWTGATAESVAGSQFLTEEQYAALFGQVPNDVPWYRQSTR